MEQVALNGGTIKGWLSSVYKEGVKPVEVSEDFKPLVAGNIKLHKGILTFNMLPMVTCGGKICQGCYDVRSLRYTSVRKKTLSEYFPCNA